MPTSVAMIAYARLQVRLIPNACIADAGFAALIRQQLECCRCSAYHEIVVSLEAGGDVVR